jgi:hypothetical protein
MADKDPKLTAKEIEEIMEARQKGEQDIVEKLSEQLDFSKQIADQYKNVQKSIKNAYSDLDKTKTAMREQQTAIRDNNIELQSIGEKINDNKKVLERHESIVKNINILESEKLSLLEEAESLGRKILKNDGLLQRIDKDMLSNMQSRGLLTDKAEENAKKQLDIAFKLRDVELDIREGGEGDTHTAESYKKLMEERAELQKQSHTLSIEQSLLNKEFTQSEVAYGELINERNRTIERGVGLIDAQVLASEQLKTVEIDLASEIKKRKKIEKKNDIPAIGKENLELEKRQGYLQAENVGRRKEINILLKKSKEITEEISNLTGKLNFWKLIQMAYERFVELDKAAESFRKETGFSINQMVQLRSDAESVNRQFQDMGVGIKEVYTSAKALTDVFGRTSLITKETLGNVALLSANLGVAEADSANVLANFQGLGGATQEAAMNVIKVGAGISEKAGVPFKLVMNDIANASEQTTAMLGSNPSKLMKSAIAARALGTDMNKIVASQRKLLDYSSSINDELELSALLGKSVSFQKARQLAYDGDIAGAAKATLDTVKKAGDFEKMSVYQREKLAVAAGMELKDLSKMIAVEKQRDAILLGGDQAAKDKLLAQEAELENLKNMASLDDANLVKQNEKVLMQQKMQGMMSNFANTFQSLLVSLADILEPVVRVVAMILLPAFKIVSALIRGMLKPILNIGQALMGNAENTKKFAAFAEKVSAVMVTVYDWSEKIGEVIGEIFLALNRVTGIARLFGSNFDAVASTAKLISSLATSIASNFGFLKTIFQSVVPFVEFIASGFSRVYNLFKPLISMASNFFGVASKGASFVGPFVKVFGTIAKLAGPIGLIINAVQVVVDLVGQFMDIWSSDDMDIGEKILKSFVAIPKALYNVLVQPFIDMAAWLLNWMWPGVGDSMLKGIKSVGDAIFGGLKWPFQKMFGWFKNDSGIAGQSPSELGLMIVDGIKAIGSMLLDVITFPFRTAFNFISGIFGGDGNLGTSIVDGIKSSFGAAFDFITSAFSLVVDSIKNAASEIFGFITSPFKKALDFVKNIPFIGKLFGGNDIATESKPQIDSTTMETAGVIEVKNLDALREVVQQLTDAVANLGKSDKTETLTAGTKIDTSALEAKLDTLTNLLVGGAVRVYLDGSDVSAAMSATGR